VAQPLESCSVKVRKPSSAGTDFALSWEVHQWFDEHRPLLVRDSMRYRFHLVLANVIALVVAFGCSAAEILPLPGDKVVLNISLSEKVRVLTRLGFTNMRTHGAVERDSLGTRVSASYKVERVAVQHCDTQCVFDTAII
jgi:hypothetical protein